MVDFIRSEYVHGEQLLENEYLFSTTPSVLQQVLLLRYTIGILKVDLEDIMIAKKLTKVGNTQAVVLDKTLLSLVDADTESTFKVSIEGKKIVLEPMSQKEVDRMALEASDKIRKTQKNVFKKLAK